MEKNKDHRELGQIMDLFSFQEIAPGAPFWHAKGMMVFRELEKIIRKINDESGYEEISTPILVKKEVFEKSGHWQHYRKNMFYFDNPADKNEHLVIKPMNCPESTYIYNSKVRSYRDLPLRLAEIGRLHRNELSGTLGGLFRVRQMTMDDAHIYCRPDQVEDEIKKIIKIIDDFYALFDLKPRYVLATRPEKFLGDKKDWDAAEKSLANALKSAKIKYATEKGEGAFYGPKIEAHTKDSQNRDWQLGTAQLDLVMLPKQFDIRYVDENGAKRSPWVIHRAIFGTFERFIGLLLEHTNGNLPLWLSAVQAIILPISEKHAKYAEKVCEQLKQNGWRAEVNNKNETLSKKIRAGKLEKIPFLLIAGDEEVKAKKVTVESRDRGNLGQTAVADFIKDNPRLFY